MTPSGCPGIPPGEALFSRTQNPAEEITPMPKPVLTVAAAWAAFDAAVANAEKVAVRRMSTPALRRDPTSCWQGLNRRSR